MSIKPKNKRISMSGHFPRIRRAEPHRGHRGNLDQFEIIIKLDYIQKMITQIEKFSLKDIIELYDNDPIARRAGNQHQRKFTLEYLRFVCHWLKNKINRQDVSTLKESRVKTLERA